MAIDRRLVERRVRALFETEKDLMDTGKTQVAYKKGEVYLCDLYGDGYRLKEVEVLDISPAAKAVKTDESGWIDAAKFHSTVKGKIGRAEYRGWWMLERRTVVKT